MGLWTRVYMSHRCFCRGPWWARRELNKADWVHVDEKGSERVWRRMVYSVKTKTGKYRFIKLSPGEFAKREGEREKC